MMTFLIISALLTLVYVGLAIWHFKKLPHSISAMVYDLPKKWQWVWTAWLALATTLIAPPLIAAMPPTWFSISANSFIVCLAMVAAMPLIPGNNEAHEFIAIIAGILSQVCVAIINNYWLLTWLLFIAIFIYSVKKKGKSIFDGKGVFVTEAICWLSLVGSIAVKLL